jgi:hypothetical protein
MCPDAFGSVDTANRFGYTSKIIHLGLYQSINEDCISYNYILSSMKIITDKCDKVILLQVRIELSDNKELSSSE